MPRNQALVLPLRLFGIDAEVIEVVQEGWGATDKAWNMVSLNPALQVFWSKAYFGLKQLRIDAFTDSNGRLWGCVTFQFVWLPRMPSETLFDSIDLEDQDADNDTSLISKLRNHTTPWDVHLINGKSKTLIQTGHTFNVSLAWPDAIKFGYMLDIQWLLIRLTAMSGAADAADEGLLPEPDPGQEMMDWIRNLFESDDFESFEEP